jgi:hypothetical protein
MQSIIKKASSNLLIVLFLGLFANALHAQEKPKVGSVELEKTYPPKFTCQWGEMNPDESWGCTGMIGLMRLTRNVYGTQPSLMKKASKVLFGSEELPSVGSEITIKRSAHLRREYWPERDDQEVGKQQKICTGMGCNDNWKKGDCGKSVGEFSFYSRNMKDRMKFVRPKGVICPGPTDLTDYLAAGTAVKILGYQQMGAFFVLVQVVKIESIFPLDDEKKYEFDYNEII